ncbi:MAG: SUF system Fe-S cluster assembly regulator [Candidatus Rariloculaceae bacterium]|jgi:FeS assembly SUF system regulator|nr:SUF system Fe-S cluster assembly regulator [Gammaproteobacteria bacterium]|tara:strand:+ start:1312 stop:1773 length:462 start_codon:yes stop_codon:yes gene_type:complete
MLKMSKLTDYGTLVLAQLSVDEGRLSSAHKVAESTHLNQPTVSKLLKALNQAGLVVSQRGSQGGYALARPPEEISAAQIIDALEGPVAITECSSGHGLCDLESVCRVGSAWQRINIKIRQALEEVSLTDLQYSSEPPAGPNFRATLKPYSKLS